MIEAEQSWNVAENVGTNLEKIEELYLHMIEQEKKIQKVMECLILLEQQIKKKDNYLSITGIASFWGRANW